MTNSIIALLGQTIEVAKQSRFALSLNEKPKTTRLESRIDVVFKKSGVGFVADADQRIRDIQLYSNGFSGFAASEGIDEFCGAFPESFSFSDSRQSVQEKLGSPSASGGGEILPIFGKAPDWDRYDRDSYSLHLRYSKDGNAIDLVTVMRPDTVAR